MHATSKQIQHLAASYYQQQLLSDEELEVKYHMAECDRCYEEFCAELLMLRALADSGLVKPQMLEVAESDSSRSFIKLQLVQDKLKLLRGSMQNLQVIWNFLPRPALAYGRGTGVQAAGSGYISQESEYSCIQREGGKIRIQLDEDYFPVKALAVRYMESGKYVCQAFSYDEYSECYTAVIEESVLENGEIEIVEI